MMLDSREAFVDYTMPLGLHHLIGGDHYAPDARERGPPPRRLVGPLLPPGRRRRHRLTTARGQGSGAVDQYRSPVREEWSDPSTCPETLLLWFHRLPWDHPMRSGRTLWEELVREYTRGAEQARDLETRWKSLQGKVDDERHRAVQVKLHQQAEDAAAWRDKCLRYFGRFSGKPVPGLAE